MLDPKLVRESPELVRAAIAKKHLSVDLDSVLAADAAWRALLLEVEQLRSVQKAANAAMAALKKGSPEFLAKLGEMKAVSAQLKERDGALKAAEERSREAMLSLPNLPHASVPEGRTPQENAVVSTQGDPGAVGAHAVAHWDIPGFPRLFDFERGAKVTGAGFPFFIGDGARLARALINFFLE
jgi:seryl-tRNA synthetase